MNLICTRNTRGQDFPNINKKVLDQNICHKITIKRRNLFPHSLQYLKYKSTSLKIKYRNLPFILLKDILFILESSLNIRWTAQISLVPFLFFEFWDKIMHKISFAHDWSLKYTRFVVLLHCIHLLGQYFHFFKLE